MTGITLNISVILSDISGITGIGLVDEGAVPFGWVADLVGEEVRPFDLVVDVIDEGMVLVFPPVLLQPGMHTSKARIRLAATSACALMEQSPVFLFFMVHPRYRCAALQVQGEI